MKTRVSILGVLSFSCLLGFSSQASSENMVVSNFLAHIGMEIGSDTPVSTDWNMPESIAVSNDVFSLSFERHSKTYYGSIMSTNAVPVGQFEINISSSESGARMFWGVRQTSIPLPPNLYYDSYSIQSDSRGFISVWETSVNAMNITNRIQNRVCVLFQNISVDVESNQVAPEEVALALLRAGGVNIPDETQPEPSATP